MDTGSGPEFPPTQYKVPNFLDSIPLYKVHEQ
jgi:hypothetical protein